MAKHIVFVHGAWHSSEAFSKVIALLSPQYKCHTVELPCTGDKAAVSTIEDDNAAVRQVTVEAIGAGEDVVVLCHSYGGLPTNNALKGLLQVDRQAKGERGGVTAIAMVSAFLVEELADAPPPAPWMDISESGDISSLKPGAAVPIFYHDVPTEEATYWASTLRKQRHGAPRTVSYTAWKHVPVFYLLCEQDQALPIAVQEGWVAAAKEAGADIRETRCNASHSPFLSQPEFVVKFIQAACGDGPAP